MGVKELSLRDIERMERVFSEVRVLEESEVFSLAKSYFKDSKFFFKRGEYVNAFEAVTISWAYVDSLLHFNKVEVPDELKNLFTI